MSYDKLISKWQRIKSDRKKMSAEKKQDILLKGKSIFKKYNVKKVILFGSVLSGQSQSHSDIDLLVYPLTTEQYWQFQFELEQLIGSPIDLYTQDDDFIFVKKIMERGEVIYEA